MNREVIAKIVLANYFFLYTFVKFKLQFNVGCHFVMKKLSQNIHRFNLNNKYFEGAFFCCI